MLISNSSKSDERKIILDVEPRFLLVAFESSLLHYFRAIFLEEVIGNNLPI